MAGKPQYIPTPKQIAAECAKIQAEKQAAFDAGGVAHCDEPMHDTRIIRVLIDHRKRLEK